MTGDEDEAQEVVSEVVVVVGGLVDDGLRAGRRGQGLAAQLLVLALEDRSAAQEVDGAALADGHEPGPRVVGDAGPGPLLERGGEGVVRQVFPDADIADVPGQPGDEAGRLDPPHGVDGAARPPVVMARHRNHPSTSDTGP